MDQKPWASPLSVDWKLPYIEEEIDDEDFLTMDDEPVSMDSEPITMQ